MTEDKPHKRSHKEHLQAERHREAQNRELNPLREPVCGKSAVQECREQCDRRNDQTDRETLNTQNHENRRILRRVNDSVCQTHCKFGNDKKDQTEYNHIFNPHLLNGQRKHLIIQTSELHGDRVAGHTVDHAEHHHKGKYNTLKLCLWHNFLLFSYLIDKGRRSFAFHTTVCIAKHPLRAGCRTENVSAERRVVCVMTAKKRHQILQGPSDIGPSDI